ncbi:MAG: MGMT family protein [Saonia sp.]
MKFPKIVPVPEKMQKYYGSGRMLHPEIEMVEEVIRTIPQGKVTTIDAVAHMMAKTYGADVACPMRTGNHLKRISKAYDTDSIPTSLPFWRVIRTDKRMVKLENYEFWATVLEKEGWALEYTKTNAIKVIVKENQLFDFS